jgi:type III pantothenate kinase
VNSLYFDLGNTRIKWWDGEHSGVLSYDELPNNIAEICNRQGSLDELVFASVVKDARRERFLNSVACCPVRNIKECVVTSSALGVICAYSDPGRLGVDRWLAVIGAWGLFGQASLVADLGTAATLDFLAGDGRHLGGYILPGLRLGIKGLLAGTSNVMVDQDRLSEATFLPGRNTNEAVYNGALAAMVDVIEGSLARLKLDYPEAKLLLSGGDARLVARQLGCQYEVRDQLVFEGMLLLHRHGLTIDVPHQDND